MMKRSIIEWIALLLLVGSTACAEDLTIIVSNPSNIERTNEPVVIPWTYILRNLPSAGGVELFDANGRKREVQVDDLDFDGSPDELTFLASLAAGEEQTFTLHELTKDVVRTISLKTDAQDWKRINKILQSVDDDDNAGTARERKSYRFDGIGWESEVIGYRLYLDERNAVDIQGKRIPGLYWKWIGESGVDYQLDAKWGMDVLHVGPALGVGGIAFWVGDSVLKPLQIDRQRTRIVARGPVRAVVSVEYTGWDIGSEKVNLTSLFTIYVGSRVSEHRVTLTGTSSSKTLATGIVKHDSTSASWDLTRAWLYTTGAQSRAGDGLMMSLNVPSDAVVEKTDDAYNDLLLLTLEPDHPLPILISAYWQGETGKMWNDATIEEFLMKNALRLSAPFVITFR